MNEEYKENFTRNWYVIEENKDVEVKLFSYFDTVEWRQHYAIEVDNIILIVDKYCPWDAYDILVEYKSLLKRSKLSNKGRK